MRSAKRPQIPTYPCDQDGHSGAWVDERTERGRGSVKQLDLDDERAHERLNKRQAEEKHCMQKLSEAAGTDQRTEKMNQDRRKHERDDRIVRVLGNQNEILKMKRTKPLGESSVVDNRRVFEREYDMRLFHDEEELKDHTARAQRDIRVDSITPDESAAP